MAGRTAVATIHCHTGAAPWHRLVNNGAPDRIRTRDPLITNQVLYQLSYKGDRARKIVAASARGKRSFLGGDGR